MTDETIMKGSHVVHVADTQAHGIGTVTEIEGQRYNVAWSMPGSMSLVRWEDETSIRLATAEDIEAARKA